MILFSEPSVFWINRDSTVNWLMVQQTTSLITETLTANQRSVLADTNTYVPKYIQNEFNLGM